MFIATPLLYILIQDVSIPVLPLTLALEMQSRFKKALVLSLSLNPSFCNPTTAEPNPLTIDLWEEVRPFQQAFHMATDYLPEVSRSLFYREPFPIWANWFEQLKLVENARLIDLHAAADSFFYALAQSEEVHKLLESRNGRHTDCLASSMPNCARSVADMINSSLGPRAPEHLVTTLRFLEASTLRELGLSREEQRAYAVVFVMGVLYSGMGTLKQFTRSKLIEPLLAASDNGEYMELDFMELGHNFLVDVRRPSPMMQCVEDAKSVSRSFLSLHARPLMWLLTVENFAGFSRAPLSDQDNENMLLSRSIAKELAHVRDALADSMRDDLLHVKTYQKLQRLKSAFSQCEATWDRSRRYLILEQVEGEEEEDDNAKKTILERFKYRSFDTLEDDIRSDEEEIRASGVDSLTLEGAPWWLTCVPCAGI